MLLKGALGKLNFKHNITATQSSVHWRVFHLQGFSGRFSKITSQKFLAKLVFQLGHLFVFQIIYLGSIKLPDDSCDLGVRPLEALNILCICEVRTILIIF